MKKLIRTILLSATLLTTSLGYAQELSRISGAFADVGFGTRPVSMGYAFVGLADDENGTFWNPAGLSQIDTYKVGFSQADQLGLIKYNYFSALIPLPFKNQSVGVSAISSGDAALKELSFHAAYGAKFDFVSVGVGLKYRNASYGNNTLNPDDYIVFDPNEISIGLGQQVYGNANGFGLDIGLMFFPSKRVQFGVLIRDLYAPMKWDSKARDTENNTRGSYDEGIPMEVIFGSALKLNKNIQFVGDYQPALSDELTNWVRLGVEGRLVNVLLLRAGTEQGINDYDDEKFTLGTGIDLSIKDKVRIQADFAYVINSIHNSQRISFSISF